MITNGSFETFNPSDFGFAGYANTNTSIPGWTGAQSDGFIRTGINGNVNGAFDTSGTVFADNGVVPDGSYVGFLQAPDIGSAFTSLTQSVSGLVDGQAYELSFYFNARANADGGGTKVGVTLGTQTLLSPTLDLPVQTQGTFTAPYHFTSIDFTYSAAWGSNLSFIATLTANQGSVLLDNVVLTPVPEPQTWALAALGVSAVVFRLRRRQRN